MAQLGGFRELSFQPQNGKRLYKTSKRGDIDALWEIVKNKMNGERQPLVQLSIDMGS